MSKERPGRTRISRELMIFFWESKWYFLAPMVSLLLLLGVLLVFAESTGVSALIYTLF